MPEASGAVRPKCPTPPHFDRLNYFFGQMLGAADFHAEQAYFREKSKLHNRCLHGYGTVCGLLIAPSEPAPGCEPDEKKPELVISPGLALDAEGNELIIRDGDPPWVVHLWEELSDADRKKVLDACKDDAEETCYPAPIYVSIRFSQCGFSTSRPVVADPCGRGLPPEHGKIREGVCVVVSTKAPSDDERCETCCGGPCPCGGLLLAQIDRFHPRRAVRAGQIHNEARRRLSNYPPTVITGVNWRHGSDEYTRHETGELLKEGLRIHFSRPVWTESLRKGVVDVYHVESRSTRHPNIIELQGKIEHDQGDTTKLLRYRLPHLEECPEPGDRVVIVVRCAFILDHCCRPVDGLNVGGRVPYVDPDGCPLPEEAHPPAAYKHCKVPPWGYGPWTSGGASGGGGTFESWFYVHEGKKP